MQKYLIFTLSGPMQAWGTMAVGEVRPSASHPTRSGLLGLLAALLGIRRGDSRLKDLNEACRVAVRVDSSGSRFVDFHTIQTPSEKGKRVFRTRRDELVNMLDSDEELNTILSKREYLTDAMFTACIWLEGQASFTLKQMREALLEPMLTPYLGRKSCPLGWPFMPQLIEAKNVRQALASYAPPEELVRKSENVVWAEDGHKIHGEFDAYIVRDQVTDHGRRLFGTRQEYHLPAPVAEE